MQINKNPKLKDFEQGSIKAKLWDAFQTESETILSLAYYYAKGYELGGDDVTTAWNNTARQTDALNRAYQKGFTEGIQWQKERETSNK